MKKILIFSLLVILFLSLASALEVRKIELEPVTRFKENTSYVNHTRADISQEPYSITSKDIARVSFKKRYVDTSFDMCFDFPVNNKKIIVNRIEQDTLLEIFDKNLNELEREDKRICAKTFSNSNNVDIDYQLSYNGTGTIKYNVSILPSRYNRDYELAKQNDDLVVLDPYLVGDLKEKTQLYLPFDGDITATSIVISEVTEVNATSTGTSGSAWTNIANAYDDSFSTYARNTNIADGYIYFNYTKYPDSYQAKWTVKDYSATATLDIPESCWNYNANQLELRAMYDYPAIDIQWACNDGTWNLLRTGNADRVYEEEITWTITNSTPSVLNTSYHIFGAVGYDFKLMGSSADIFGTDNGADTGMSYTGQGAVFDGTTSFVDLGSNGWEETICDNGCSFCTWFETNDNTSSQAMISRYDTTSNNAFLTLYINSDSIRFLFSHDGDDIFGVNSAYKLVKENTWIQACGIYNGTNTTVGNALLYINGAFVDNSNQAEILNSTAWADDENLYISTWDNGNQNAFFNGTMRNVYIYDYALTPREVSFLYTNGTYINNTINETNSAIEFYNSSIKDGVRLQTAINYDLKGGSTFAFWADGGTTNVKQLLGFSTTDNTRSLTLYNSASGIYFETNSNGDVCYAPVTLDDEWHHYVLKVLDYECTIYEDGTAVTMTDDTVTDNVTFDMVGRTQMDSTVNPYGMDGGLDELMIFDYALSLTEIQTLSGGYNSAINFSLYDADNLNLITNDNIDVHVYIESVNYSDSITITNGIGTMYGLPEGYARIYINSDNYDTSLSYYTVPYNQQSNLSFYLTEINNTLARTFIIKEASTGKLLEGVTLILKDELATGKPTIAQKVTDFNGQALAYLDPTVLYELTLTKSGYDTKIVSFTPIDTSYTIFLGSTYVPDEGDKFDDLDYSIEPTYTNLQQNTSYDFNFTISSSESSLEYWGIQVDNNGVVTTSNLSTAGGGTTGLTITTDINATHYLPVEVTYFYKRENFPEWSMTKVYYAFDTSAYNNTIGNMFSGFKESFNLQNDTIIPTTGILMTTTMIGLGGSLITSFGFVASGLIITTLMVIILSVFAGQGFISWYLWSFISVPLLLWIWIFKRN